MISKKVLRNIARFKKREKAMKKRQKQKSNKYHCGGNRAQAITMCRNSRGQFVSKRRR